MKDFSFSFLSPDTSSEVVDKVYIQTQHNNLTSDAMRKRPMKYDDSQAVGKYNTIDTEEWEEIACSIMDENRLYVGRGNGKVDATVYIQVEPEGRFDLCNNYVLFHKKDWTEYRKERGANHFLRLYH